MMLRSQARRLLIVEGTSRSASRQRSLSTSHHVAMIPVIDVGAPNKHETAAKIYDACSTWGAFVAVGHGVPFRLREQVFDQARAFFSLPEEEKIKHHVRNGGLAWRGYMPLGGEYTHGKRDEKEGLYLGPDHGADHPRAGTPLYGLNQLPDEALPSLRPSLLAYIEEVTALGQRLMGLLSLSLQLEEGYIQRHITYEPLAIVRVFRYTPQEQGEGIGEHTDYGLWTMLATSAPGLAFKHPEHGWVDVPFLEDGILCNVGDVLDRMTEGRFKSRPHRVRNRSGQDRISIPFFFDPAWDSKVAPLPLSHLPLPSDPDRQARWDATSIVKLEGEYSAFLAKKVSKIFNLQDVARTLDTTKGPSTRFHIDIVPPSAGPRESA